MNTISATTTQYHHDIFDITQYAVHKLGLLLPMSYTVVCVGHTCQLCKIGWTNWNAVWGLIHVGPKNHVLDGVQISHGNGPKRGITTRWCVFFPTYFGHLSCLVSLSTYTNHCTSRVLFVDNA